MYSVETKVVLYPHTFHRIKENTSKMAYMYMYILFSTHGVKISEIVPCIYSSLLYTIYSSF